MMIVQFGFAPQSLVFAEARVPLGLEHTGSSCITRVECGSWAGGAAWKAAAEVSHASNAAQSG
jgi:hypothetical protein